MDRQVNPEQDGPLSDSGRTGDGSAYLRQLKDLASETARVVSAPFDGSPDVDKPPGGVERRRSPRVRCSGSAEFRVEGSDVRMWGTLTDISLHGCYVEMNNTFPVDTRVNLTLEAVGIRVRVRAAVRVSYPFLGMGMCFTEIEPGQRLQLARLLATSTGGDSASPSTSTPAPAAHSTHSLADVDADAMLDELTQFFRGNHLLSRDEFYQIANRSRR